MGAATAYRLAAAAAPSAATVRGAASRLTVADAAATARDAARLLAPSPAAGARGFGMADAADVVAFVEAAVGSWPAPTPGDGVRGANHAPLSFT